MLIRKIFAPVFLIACFGVSAWAQASKQSPDPGVSPNVLLNNSQVRVSRVEVQPGATRRMHKHEDVRFHLFLPITGTLELTVGSQAPVAATPGHATYIEKGAMHGFKNSGASVAMVYEVFVYLGAQAAQNHETDNQGDALAWAMAFAGTAPQAGSKSISAP